MLMQLRQIAETSSLAFPVMLVALFSMPLCVPQSNVLEASPDMKRESEKEWYFGNADKERRGPFSYEEVRLEASEVGV